MSVPGSANSLLLASAAGGYQISRSVRLNSADSAFFSRTPASAGNRKTWTCAAWVKRAKLSEETGVFAARTNSSVRVFCGFDASTNSAQVYANDGAINVLTAGTFRDLSAWYHVIFSFDTTQATSSNRVKIYVNGVQQTLSGTFPSQNVDFDVNNTVQHTLASSSSIGGFTNLSLAEIYLIDGQALDSSSFGEFDTNGIWQPKRYSGTYGTNGFKLDFADNSSNTATTLGKDTSGNGNNWLPNNLSVTAGAGNDSLVDSPTNYGTDTGVGGEVRGNYCTLNPLQVLGTLANGNLEASVNNGVAYSTIAMSSGKWYFEMTAGSTGDHYAGIYATTGLPAVNTATSYAYAATAAGQVVGIAVDITNGYIWYSRNGVWQASGNPATGANPNPASASNTPNSATIQANTWVFSVQSGNGANATTVNFGQRPFAYPLSGFKALCTANLPAPVITKPSSVFDVVTYTGTGSTLTPTSSLGFNPDLVWIKSRSAATDHTLYDSVRGAQARLESNTTDAEVTSDNGLTAFNSNGFTLGTLAQVNTNAATYSSWAWDAGSTTVTNTDGNITSTVRANASAGFSIVTYTGNGVNGATVGHGLNAPIGLVIQKRRNSGTEPWNIWHLSLPGLSRNFLRFETIAAGSASDLFTSSPTSSLVYVGNSSSSNASAGSYLLYCFAPVSSYSSFGSYAGNGSTDGPFVFCNFRPRWILLKRTDTTSNWTIIDTAREGYNVDNDPLFPNLSDAEGTADLADILSNGFKLRSTDASVNANTGTYVYACFAESPFSLARAR
jgi:hypothetical protein